MLTAQAAQITLEDHKEHAARMRFFRRLHTKKYPHLFIDYERVLCIEKPVRG
jgi:hypothetical protein